MLVKSPKLTRSLQRYPTSRIFSPREAYREESMKGAPDLRDSRCLAAILTTDDVEGSFNDMGRVCHYARMVRSS